MAPGVRAILDTNLVTAADVPPLDGDLAVSVVTVASCTSAFWWHGSPPSVLNDCAG